jgi:hypothetical protein
VIIGWFAMSHADVALMLFRFVAGFRLAWAVAP